MRWSFLAVGSALLVSALLATAASAGSFKVRNLQAISGPSPFAAGCPCALFDAITASPTLDAHAYLVWANFSSVDVPRTNTLAFSRTTDGGATWSRPVLIDQPSPFAWDVAPRLLVLRNGTLLTIFVRIDAELEFGAHYAARSLDEGRTWLPPVQIGPPVGPPLPVFFHPEFGELPQAHYPSAAVAPDGTAYIAFENNSSATLQRNRCGQVARWRPYVDELDAPGVSAYAFEPAIAVDKHGTAGLIWYDLRNDRPGDAALTADVWFGHADDRGSSWRQTHVDGPTDLQTVPVPASSTTSASTRGSRDSVTGSLPTSHWQPRRRRTALRTSSSPGSNRAMATVTRSVS